MELVRFLPITKESTYTRPTLTCISMADLHFGAISPEVQYHIYHDQIVNVISKINFDIIFINGDTFDHKCMSNSDISKYALILISELVELCRVKDATLLILGGTLSHDANQLKLFYQFMIVPNVDVRIVEYLSMHNIKGMKVLCIPELYNIPETEYENYLFHMGIYDMAIIHGAYRGATMPTQATRLFTKDDFVYCRGPVLAGHVHTPGMYDGFFYYCGTPIRYEFGQEERKGFYIMLYDLESGRYYINMQEVISFRYDTLVLNNIPSTDPQEIIQYIANYKDMNSIDNLRVKFTIKIPDDTMSILNSYYRNIPMIRIEFAYDKNITIMRNNISENLDKFSRYEYILDKELSEYQILSRFINDSEGYEFITSDELKLEIETEL